VWQSRTKRTEFWWGNISDSDYLEDLGIDEDFKKERRKKKERRGKKKREKR
jgi:hypothetical protein